jgi:hypothetical protein
MKIIFEYQGQQQVVHAFSETDINILRSEIRDEILQEDLQRRLYWVIAHKIQVIEEDLKKYWLDKFMKDPNYASIPADRIAFFAMVFAHPDFQFASFKPQEA